MRDTFDMAREAGFNVKMFKPPVITAQHGNGSWVSVGDELKAFEALVRADERAAPVQEPLAWSPNIDYPGYEDQRVWANGKPRQQDIDYWNKNGNGITIAVTQSK
jgi:hypothetical protein